MARAIPYPGVTVQDLKELLQGTADKVDLDLEVLKEGEYVRAYRSDLGARSTVVSGLVLGVTFSLEVPEQVDDEAVAAVTMKTINAIRENVFLGPGTGPGRDSVQGGGRLAR